MTCTDCDKRDKCTTPCKPVKKICWENNKVMEKYYPDHIQVFPGSTRERHFCELTDKQLDEISETDTIPWNSEDTRFRQTAVFIERFFKKTPYKELAEKFGVNENSIVCMYRDAVKRVHKIISALDSRHEGMKAVSEKTFNQDEKIFLLCCCFGFNQHEVGKIFNIDHWVIHSKVKRMNDKYLSLLQKKKKESPLDDPPMPEKLTREAVVALVEHYSDQGLSNLQAFSRIAKLYGDKVGRPVNSKTVASKHRKATAAARKTAGSIYEGMTSEQIAARISFTA